MNYRRAWIIFLLTFSGIAGLTISLYFHHEPNVEYSESSRVFHYPATFVRQIQRDPNAGEKIFEHYCAICHGKNPSVPVRAPIIGDKKAWVPYQKMKLSDLLKIVSVGNGAMPARGGCFECNDVLLKKAVIYLLEHSK